ncbi:unnamed protein product [Rotaria magnacalcarata]|uniref:Uncharacterized protein n=2 Tax=Rotaria magnacalcarata TaxID=392030 RepID=A0A816MQ64_9BILA|nr:unnamed protein product [Rotaria magnacalcarata]CAF2066627.1 unnamed protein product [Rotaria magnacalcarata]
MTCDMTNGTAKFERMTKEEKLRFCQDLIKQAANLTKSSDISSGIYSTESRSSLSDGIRSSSKSSKRPPSPSGTLSKKTKSGTLSQKNKSKSHTKSSVPKSKSKSSKSHKTEKSKVNTHSHSTTPSEDSKSKANSKKSIKTTSASCLRSSAKTGNNDFNLIIENTVFFYLCLDGKHKSKSKSKSSKSGTTKRPTSKSSTSKTASNSSLKLDGTSAIRSTSHTSGKHTTVKSSTAKAGSKTDLEGFTSASISPSSMHTKSGTISKSKVHSQSQQAPGSHSSVRSMVASKSHKKTNKITKAKSSSKKKAATSTIHSTMKSSPIRSQSGIKTQLTSIKTNSTKSSTKSKGKSESKHSRMPMKDRTETCAVQFVPKFNPNSNKNQVPIYHLIRHAFGNMVREAICQLDKEKSGVSSQEIIDHILKYYSFPNNVSESAIRNRTIFTINAGLRAGTLLTVSPNKGVRIGRMRRVYPHMLC